jgi:hypothetical protein
MSGPAWKLHTSSIEMNSEQLIGNSNCGVKKSNWYTPLSTGSCSDDVACSISPPCMSSGDVKNGTSLLVKIPS